MKNLIVATIALAFACTLGVAANAGSIPNGFNTVQALTNATVEKHRKPRIPGGSGCNSLRDLLEHPECR
jgi:hypothetical protein